MVHAPHEPAAQAAHRHTWGRAYDYRGGSYRECLEGRCRGYQEWICLLDRWSDTFDTPSPRERSERSGTIDGERA